MDFFTPIVIGVVLILITLLIYWATTFIIFYHLIRFGIGTQPKKIAFIFLLGAIGLFFMSVSAFTIVDFPGAQKSLISLVGGFVNTTYLQ
jgi:hypothetical protein